MMILTIYFLFSNFNFLTMPKNNLAREPKTRKGAKIIAQRNEGQV
jgi:hypothetical protein